ncbi:MAG: AAA family ATPase [Candidatus Odinarchaeia archaeon]
MKQKKDVLDITDSKLQEPSITEKEESQHHKTIKKMILAPVGYPLRVIGEDKSPQLTTDDAELFRTYAIDQWNGTFVKKGHFLFDQYMYPDFAFKIIYCEPKEGKITNKTKIILQNVNGFILKKRTGVYFKDVIGQDESKEKCKIIKKYLLNPEKFGEWAPKNILFYGPPGTGKTMMALALANETNASIFLTKATDLIGSHVGGGARRIHQLYQKAKEVKPSIIFIDELDAIGLDRRYQSIRGDVSEIVNALLSELDGINSNLGIVTIGSTNAIDILDNALRSRFEEEIEFKLPNKEDRAKLIKLYSEKLPIPFEADIEKLSEELEGFSGRDIKEKVLKTLLHKAILKGKKKIDSKMVFDFISKLKKNEKHYKNNRLYL